MEPKFTLENIKAMFTHPRGFHFSRWSKNISPAVFGTDDIDLSIIKNSFMEIISLADLEMVEVDPDLGANLLIFFCKDWSDLTLVPKIEKLVPDLQSLIVNFCKTDANQYRKFGLYTDGSIKFCLIFLRYNEDMAAIPLKALAKIQLTKAILLWSESTFKMESPVFVNSHNNLIKLKPKYSTLIKVCYDPVLPNSSYDEAYALRVLSRFNVYNGYI